VGRNIAMGGVDQKLFFLVVDPGLALSVASLGGQGWNWTWENRHFIVLIMIEVILLLLLLLISLSYRCQSPYYGEATRQICLTFDIAFLMDDE
jgi:hypothetical protein